MIVTLCGSSRFKDYFMVWNRELTKQGYIVLAPGVFSHAGDMITDEQKEKLDTLHKKKIAMSDCVCIINKDGYIGDSTKSEIEFAEALNIPVKYLYSDKEKKE